MDSELNGVIMNLIEVSRYFENSVSSNQEFVEIDSICKRYCMNRSGAIWDTKLRRPQVAREIAGRLVVDLILESGTKRIILNKLFLMAFRPLHTDLETYLKCEVIVYDKAEWKPTLENLMWRMPASGISNNKFSGYFTIPGNPGLVVNKELKFLRTDDSTEARILIPNNSDLYPTINIKPMEPRDPFYTRTVHRLVGLAFIPLPDDLKSSYINHIDADKCNYEVKNLEWVNHSQNNDHAIRNGLRGDCFRVKAYNIDTKEVRTYVSFNECARDLNSHPGLVSNAINFYKDRGYVKVKPWILLLESDPAPRLNKSSLYVTITHEQLFYHALNVVTKEEFYAYGRRELGEKMNLKNARKIMDTIPLSYEQFSLGDYVITPKLEYLLSDEIKSIKPAPSYGNKPPIPIIVTHIPTGTIIEYRCTEDFALEMGAKKKSIQHVANLFGGRWKSYHIEYKRDVKAPKNHIVSPASNSSVK